MNRTLENFVVDLDDDEVVRVSVGVDLVQSRLEGEEDGGVDIGCLLHIPPIDDVR